MLDARIPLGANALSIEPRTNALARVLQLQGMMQQQQLAKMQAEDMHAGRDLQRKQLAAQLAEAEAKRAALARLPSPQGVAVQNALAAGGGPTVANAQNMRPVDPRAALIHQLVSLGMMPPEKLVEAHDPNFGRPKIASWQERAGQGGRPEKVGVTDFGDMVGQALPQAVKMEMKDTGGALAAFDPYGLKPGQQFTKTLSPGERDASARGWAGIGIQRQAEARQAAKDALPEYSADAGGFVNRRTQTVTPVAGSSSQATLASQFGKAAPGYRWKQDGSQEPIPGGPADRKSNEQLAGKETVDSVVASLRSAYDALETGGGITSTKKGPIDNLGAAASRSQVGQMVGGALGTKNQKERDSIAQARPLLLQAIMKATGMSAKQMDSNAELKLYLATATDPTLTLEANRGALDRIEQLYGSGGLGKAPKPPAADPSKPTVSNW